MIYSIRHTSRHDRRIPLLLAYVGASHLPERVRYPGGTDFFMIYYCTEDRCDCMLDGRQLILHPGQFLLTVPKTPYAILPKNDDVRICLLGLTGPCCSALLESCGMHTPSIYQVSRTELIPEAIDQLLSIQQNTEGGHPSQKDFSAVSYRLLLDLSGCIQRLADAAPPASQNDTVMIVIDYLESHYSEPLSLDDLAEQVHLTKEYLCTLFKKEMHHTILQHLTVIRIGWARMFLEQYPEKKVYEIGQMCGFESPSYFGKKFHEIVGITPENYRHVNAVTLK